MADSREAFLQQLLQKRDVPAMLEHQEDDRLLRPTQWIRQFVEQLWKVMGDERPSDWSLVPVDTFHRSHRNLRRSIEQFCGYLQQRPDATKEMLFSAQLLGESALALANIDYSSDVLRVSQRETAWVENDPQMARIPSHGELLGRTYEASAETLSMLAVRPFPHLYLDQLYCTPDSTERRMLQALLCLPPQGGRVLCLGDDDLGSLLLSAWYDGEIHAVDFDERLLEHIARLAPQVHCHRLDLVRGGLPRSMRESFDVVILDPPWDEHGAWCFLDKAIYALKRTPTARILLSFCPLFLERLEGRMPAFWRSMSRRGMVCEALLPWFHLYSLHETEFFELLLHDLPDVESPLLSCLRGLPYGFSHLYVLRRLSGVRPNPLWKWWFDWWHGQSEG